MAARIRFINPEALAKSPAYTQVVEVGGPCRTLFVSGQLGTDRDGNILRDFRAQAVQVMENIKIALAAVGGSFENVVKLNSYLVDIATNQPTYRDVRASYFSGKAALPASTSVGVPALAQAGFLIEVEAIAVLPPKA